jgi:hypothetical protein
MKINKFQIKIKKKLKNEEKKILPYAISSEKDFSIYICLIVTNGFYFILA